MLQSFFKSLLNPKIRAASPGRSMVSPGAAAGKLAAAGSMMSSDTLVVVVVVVRVGVEVRRRILVIVEGRRVGE